MFDNSEYRLIEFGDQLKIEMFGGISVERPSPVAKGRLLSSSQSPEPQIRFQQDSIADPSSKGIWANLACVPEQWSIRHGELVFRLKPTPFGHLGIFPEQASNWTWIQKLPIELQGLRALNLFAYTGGTTMALAKRGCQVTHIDAAQNVVNWARENASLSGLGNAPIRWIAEDVMRYVDREIKRGSRYDIVVADPPTFGRGPRNETWKMDRDFEHLLDGLVQLTNARPKVCLMSCHTSGFEHPELRRLVTSRFQEQGLKFADFQMTLAAKTKKVLPAGHCLRAYQPSG